jgi:hypothetical protein
MKVELKKRPIQKWAEGIVSQHMKKKPVREGYAWERKDIDNITLLVRYATYSEDCFMDVIASLKSNYDEANTLWQNYEKKLENFRSMVKNDVTSLEANARKTTDAVHKMNKAYGDAIAQMTSNEMQTAIENAERLARAMEALAAVQAQKLTFEIADKK